MANIKDGLLLDLLKEWWNDIEDYELAEILMGDGEIDHEDVSKFYPDAFDDEGEVVDGVEKQVIKDANDLIARLKGMLEKGK